MGLLQSAATLLYIAEIISRSDWTVINGISRRGLNAVTPRAVDNFSRVPGPIYDMGFCKSDVSLAESRVPFPVKKEQRRTRKRGRAHCTAARFLFLLANFVSLSRGSLRMHN